MQTIKKKFFIIFIPVANPNFYRKEKDKLKVIPKAGHRLALGMKLQKEMISNQKQPSCKEGCGL